MQDISYFLIYLCYGVCMVKQSTLRSRGFRLVKVGGPKTLLSNDKPFTVNGKAANYRNGEYRINLLNWFYGDIDRDIELIQEN